jgi:hypothetical protein
MNPRNTLAFWQNFARAPERVIFAFAKFGALRKATPMHRGVSIPVACMTDCYPFPSYWSGSFGVRPFFLQAAPQAASLRNQTQKFQFKSAKNPVESLVITTNQRGSSKCIKPLSFLRFARLLCQAASVQTPPPLVRASAPSRGSRLARLPKTTWPNRLWLAARRASLPAMQAFAADLAAQTEQPLTKASRGISVAGLLQFHARASGPSPAFRGESYV